MMYGGFGAPRAPSVFQQPYLTRSYIDVGRYDLENTDKIILPESSSAILFSMELTYPMTFSITSQTTGLRTHGGVLEFTAEEGMCYMPSWLMDKLGIAQFETVIIRNVSLPKARYVKIRPHLTDFIEKPNPKAVLEIALRSLSCVTKDDTIKVDFNSQPYYLDILEIKNEQQQQCDAADIRETDLETDFAEPLDYKQVMEKRQIEEQAKSSSSTAFNPTKVLSGKGGFVNDHEEEAPKFVPFAGGQRLDGKPMKNEGSSMSTVPTTSSTSTTSTSTSTPPSSLPSSTHQTAKLKPKANLAKFSTKNKFQNFTGAGNKF